MTRDEALKMALEALERSVATCFDQRSHDEVMGRPEHFVNKAIDAIKEALAQEQEPVAWMDEYGDVLSASVVSGKGLRNIPLYTAPPKRTWVGLTDEEILEVWKENEKVYPMDRSRLLDRTRACIRKAQIEVGCAECGVNDNNHALYCVACAEKFVGEAATKLQQKQETIEGLNRDYDLLFAEYQLLLKKEWVGLTNGEMIELSEMKLGSWDLILEVEDKLRSKNNE